jgi:hypothetical protein
MTHDEPKVETDDVPRLPRGRGLRLSGPQLVRIVGLVLVLAALLVMQRPCANAVSTFVTGFGEQGSAGSARPEPGGGSAPAAGSAEGSAAPGLEGYEQLRPGMTEAEIKAAIERARVKAAGSGTTR